MRQRHDKARRDRVRMTPPTSNPAASEAAVLGASMSASRTHGRFPAEFMTRLSWNHPATRVIRTRWPRRSSASEHDFDVPWI